MTIEEIKEIRATVRPTEQEYFDAHSVEMVDTLLDCITELERQLAERGAEIAALKQVSAELCPDCGWAMKFPGEE